jgi:hypothetical protein
MRKMKPISEKNVIVSASLAALKQRDDGRGDPLAPR